MARVEFYHDPVACHLRDDAGGGDAEADRVAAHERGLRQGKIADGQPVYENMVGGRRQLSRGAAHGFMGGAEDVDAVNLLRPDDRGRPGDVLARGQLGKDALTLCCAELFGIIQQTVREIRRKNHRCRHDRPCERAAAGLINACNKTKAPHSKKVFVREAARHGDWERASGRG